MHGNGRWRAARHLRVLDEYLIQAISGGITRIVLNMPPRHGKSELFSKYLPVSYLGTYPDKRVVLASYEAEFAASWGGKGKQIMDEVGPELWDLHLGSKRSDHNWSLARLVNGKLRDTGGGMQTAGVGGPLTGKGADLFLIDDPIKNDMDARSQVKREHMWDWFISTAMTRLEPGAVMAILMTRWHEDDLTGRVLKMAKETGEQWVHVSLPAICEDETLPIEQKLGRKKGGALWAWKYNESYLQMTKARSHFWWNGLYQQRPAPPEGNLVKSAWIRYFSIEIHNDEKFYHLFTPNGERIVKASTCRIFFTIDLAASTKTEADFTVVSVWAMIPGTTELLWLDAVAEQMEGPDQQTLIKKMNTEWKPLLIGVEATAYQLTMIQTLLKEGLPAFKLKADKDKVSRFIPAGNHYQNGLVYHRQFGKWLADAEPQLLHFPKATHDDYVDTVSYAYRMIEYVDGVGESKIVGG